MAEAIVTAIRDTLTDSQPYPGGWVRVAELRDWINTDATPDELDAVLLTEYVAHRLRLTSEANRRTLTQQDHAAAVHSGGEPLHWVALAPRSGIELVHRVEAVIGDLAGDGWVDVDAVRAQMWDVSRTTLDAAIRESAFVTRSRGRVRIPADD